MGKLLTDYVEIRRYAMSYCKKYKVPTDLIEDIIGEALLASVEHKGDKRKIHNAMARYHMQESRYNKKRISITDLE